MESLIIRHRNRLRHHYTVTSNVLLYGYRDLSDGAKVTYLAVDSFDWSDSVGLRKGFAHPSLGRLAKIRGVEKRSIRRHLGELEGVSLITRRERPGKPSLLIIEDPSETETESYVRALAGPGEDKIVLPTPDKIVRPYKKEEREEKQNLVNEYTESDKERTQRDPGYEHVGQILDRYRRSVLRKNANPSTPIAKREYIANEVAKLLNDQRSLGCFRRIAETHSSARIWEAVGAVKELMASGNVRSPGALFVSLVRTGKIHGEASVRKETA
jgi:hypothetical protein